MEEITKKSESEMIELGMIKCYFYDKQWDSHDSTLYVKMVNDIPILLARLGMVKNNYLVEVGKFDSHARQFNAKFDSNYYLTLPSTVLNLLNSHRKD